MLRMVVPRSWTRHWIRCCKKICYRRVSGSYENKILYIFYEDLAKRTFVWDRDGCMHGFKYFEEWNSFIISLEACIHQAPLTIYEKNLIEWKSCRMGVESCHHQKAAQTIYIKYLVEWKSCRMGIESCIHQQAAQTNGRWDRPAWKVTR